MILSLALSDARFLELYADHMKAEHFPSPEEQWLVTAGLTYFNEYEDAIPTTILGIELEKATTDEKNPLSEERCEEIVALVESLPVVKPFERAYLYKSAGLWLRRAALIDAVQESTDDIQSEEYNRILPRFETAMEIGAHSEEQIPAYEFFTDAARWFTEQKEIASVGMTTGLPSLDKMINGGLHEGELGVFMAPSNRGKSHMLVWVTQRAMREGKRVLYLSLEMSIRIALARLAACITNIASNEIFDLPDGQIIGMIANDHERFPGDAVMRQYAPDDLPVRGIKSLLDEQIRKETPVDLLVVDYGDLLRPKRQRDDKWIEEGEVFVDLRRIAVQYQIPVWTATQTNRSGVTKKAKLELDTVASSFDKVKISDVIIGLLQTDEDRAMGEMVLFGSKVRNGTAREALRVKADLSTSRFREIAAVTPPAALVPGTVWGGGEEE